MKLEAPIIDQNHELATAHLAAVDPAWARLIAHVGPCRLQLWPPREPYQALIRSVAYQQLHGRAAKAILDRFLALYPEGAFPDPDTLLATDEAALRACGFSAAKIRAIRGIAEATQVGIVPTLAAARAMSNEELITRLVTLRGIGRWTVEMLLIFLLGRPDVLPVDDLGVREGWRITAGLAERPTPKALRLAGEAWQPYRSTAAWYLWRATELATPLR